MPVYVGSLTQSFAKSGKRFENFDRQSISLQWGEKDTWKRGVAEGWLKMNIGGNEIFGKTLPSKVNFEQKLVLRMSKHIFMISFILQL